MGIYARTKRSLSICSSTQTESSEAATRTIPSPSSWRNSFASNPPVDTVGPDEVLEVPSSAKPRKMVRLSYLKNGGTTFHKDIEKFEYYYNPLEIGTNPYTTKSDSGSRGFSVELLLDSSSKNVLIPDLSTDTEDSDLFDCSSTIFQSSSTAAIPNLSQAAIDSGGVTLSGKLRMNVKNTKKPILLKSHCIKLKCFVNEYVCYVDPENKRNSSSKKIIKMLKEDGIDNSHMLPLKEIKLNIENDGEFRCLSCGIYEFPFDMKLKLNEFPTSILSYFGKTLYRLESVTQIVRNGSFSKSTPDFDSILLTDEINVKRILSTTNLGLKQQTITLQGNWNDNELSYNIILNSKMLEFGVPFAMSIGLKNERSNRKLLKITISLSQTLSIPCIDSKTLEVLPTSYSKKNEVDLYEFDVDPTPYELDKLEPFQVYEIENLKVPPNDKINYCRNWLKPFYCERSPKFIDRARLKITHSVIVKLSLSTDNFRSCDSQTNRMTHLTFRLPVLLVDQDMTSNLVLPPYQKFQTVEQLCDDDPPCYYQEDDEPNPPNYVTSRANLSYLGKCV